MIPIPDGDIFGEKMDGTWQPAADLVELDTPIDEVEQAVLECLRKWERHNLPDGQSMATPFAELLSAYDPGTDTAAQRTNTLDSLQRLSVQSYGHKVMAQAAARMLSNPGAWNGMSLQFVVCALYRNTLGEAVRRGFISPLTIGAAKQAKWSMSRISEWESRLSSTVERVVSRIEPGRTLTKRRGRSDARKPAGTADILTMALPVRGR